jgi:cell division protein FtsB
LKFLHCQIQLGIFCWNTNWQLSDKEAVVVQLTNSQYALEMKLARHEQTIQQLKDEQTQLLQQIENDKQRTASMQDQVCDVIM